MSIVYLLPTTSTHYHPSNLQTHHSSTMENDNKTSHVFESSKEDDQELQKRVEAIFRDSDTEEELEDVELEVRKKVQELTDEVYRVSLRDTSDDEEEEEDTKDEPSVVEAKKVEHSKIELALPEVKTEVRKKIITKSPTPPPIAPKPVILVKKAVVYPGDLNPFGEEEEGTKETKKVYPTDLNPFGEEDEEEEVKPSKSLNPFGSDEEEEEPPPPRRTTPVPRPRTSRQSTPTPPVIQAPTPVKKARKKRLAPAPPSLNSSAISSSDMDRSNLSIGGDDHSMDSLSSAASSRTPTPLPRRSKVAESPGRQATPDSGNLNQSTLSSRISAIKSKKRPAPSIPVTKRVVKSSLVEIEAQLNSIGDQLPLVEKRRNELELWLTNNQLPVKGEEEGEGENGDDDLKAKHQEKLDEFVKVAKEWCKLAKKQKELMYTKREHKLEESQIDIEYQLRMIVSKQDAQRTEEDKQKENDLLGKMMEIVEERNDIIENMIKDENKEMEDYQKLIARVIPESRTRSKEQDTISISGSEGGKHKHHRLKLHIPKDLLKIRKKKKKALEEVAGTDNDGKVEGVALRNGLQTGLEDKEEEKDQTGKKDKKKKHFSLSKATLKKITGPMIGTSKSNADLSTASSSPQAPK